jgi:hypothetical protein
MASDPIDAAKAKRQVSPAEARAQAAEYLGFTASTEIVLDSGEVFEIPNPGLLDDDQQERFEELQAELDSFDHDEVDVPVIEYTVETRSDGTTYSEPKVVGQKKERTLLTNPHRKGGKPVKPPYNVRLAIALWGKEGYERYKAGGGISNQIALEWTRMNREFMAKVSQDPKQP